LKHLTINIVEKALNTQSQNLSHEPLVNAMGINHACELTSNRQWWSSIGVAYVYKTDAGTHVVFSLKLIKLMKHEP
jgi:hypothetical protein